MRRSEKRIDDIAEIAAILERVEVMHLGLTDEGAPYVVPLNFAHEARSRTAGPGPAPDEIPGAACTASTAASPAPLGRIVFHSALEGRKLDLIAADPRVSFCVCEGELVRGDKPCSWGASFESVIGTGVARVIEDPAEKRLALETLVARYGAANASEMGEASIGRTAVVEIVIDEMVGKRSGRLGVTAE